MRFIQTHATGSDETAPFDIMDYKAKTVGEFIDEVLKERPNEWGYFDVYGFGRCEYRSGKLLSELSDDKLRYRIKSVKAAGGWSRMDYRITVNPYLCDEEAISTIKCLACKNCLPPFERQNGKMCNLEKCNFIEA